MTRLFERNPDLLHRISDLFELGDSIDIALRRKSTAYDELRIVKLDRLEYWYNTVQKTLSFMLAEGRKVADILSSDVQNLGLYKEVDGIPGSELWPDAEKRKAEIVKAESPPGDPVSVSRRTITQSPTIRMPKVELPKAGFEDESYMFPLLDEEIEKDIHLMLFQAKRGITAMEIYENLRRQQREGFDPPVRRVPLAQIVRVIQESQTLAFDKQSTDTHGYVWFAQPKARRVSWAMPIADVEMADNSG